MQRLNLDKIDAFTGLQDTYFVDQRTGAIQGSTRGSITTGYYVAIPPSLSVYKVPDSTERDFRTLLPVRYFGIWVDEGIVYPEYSLLVKNREDALELAVAWDQKAVWDIANETSIFVD